MEGEAQRPVSFRLNRHGDRSNQTPRSKDVEGGFFSPGRLPQDYPVKIVWKRGIVRLVLVVAIVWMLLILSVLFFHVWSCQSSLVFFSALRLPCSFSLPREQQTSK